MKNTKQYKLVFLVFMFVSGLLLTSCNNNNKVKQKDNSNIALEKKTTSKSENPMNNVGPTQFKALIEKNNFELVDVRTPEEFDEGHIEGAVNINFYDATFDSDIQKLNMKKTVLVYCRSGGRSANAMNKMASFGFSKVYNLTGGFNGWKDAGLHK